MLNEARSLRRSVYQRRAGGVPSRMACTANLASEGATATTRQSLTWLKWEAAARRAGGRVSTSKGRRARSGELLATGPKQGMRAHGPVISAAEDCACSFPAHRGDFLRKRICGHAQKIVDREIFLLRTASPCGCRPRCRSMWAWCRPGAGGLGTSPHCRRPGGSWG